VYFHGFSVKNHGFVATGYHFPRKTIVLLQQGTIFGANLPKTMVLLQQGALF
jgi:hypothetical protein